MSYTDESLRQAVMSLANVVEDIVEMLDYFDKILNGNNAAGEIEWVKERLEETKRSLSRIETQRMES